MWAQGEACPPAPATPSTNPPAPLGTDGQLNLDKQPEPAPPDPDSPGQSRHGVRPREGQCPAQHHPESRGAGRPQRPPGRAGPVGRACPVSGSPRAQAWPLPRPQHSLWAPRLGPSWSSLPYDDLLARLVADHPRLPTKAPTWGPGCAARDCRSSSQLRCPLYAPAGLTLWKHPTKHHHVHPHFRTGKRAPAVTSKAPADTFMC